MANSRDFTGKNRKFTGTKGIVTPKGTTGERVGAESGELRFNTTTQLMEYYDGTTWKPIDAPPSISGITTDDATGSSIVFNADGSTLFQITINGGNFSTGCTVQFIGNTGTTYSAGSVNRVSASQITCNTIAGMGTSDDPYDVKVNNTSGLSATLDDAFSYNAPPVFVTAAGSLGNVYNGQVISGSTLDASATDAEGNTITYSLASGSLPGSGLSLSSSTGYITGTLSGTPSLGTYSFTIQAATTEGTSSRNFSIAVIANPFIAATGGNTVITDGNFKVHVFTSPGTFSVSNAGTPSGSTSVEYLVVGGGAGGASGKDNTDGNHGGGGAGGYRTNYPSPTTAGLSVSTSPGSYPITVGGGGGGGSGPNCNPTSRGSQGSNSVFSNITSAGGGGGQSDAGGTPQPAAGFPGGCGGGGSGTPSGIGGTGNTPPVSPPQGQNGGNGISSPGGPTSGGGGGSGQAGQNGGVQGGSTSGKGGDGTPIATAFFGPTSGSYGTPGPASGRYFSGGGSGGRSNNINAGGPGAGGGGAGSPNGPGNIGISGTVNTGGGGGASGSGASGNAQGGAGGSGIVVIRYKFQ